MKRRLVLALAILLALAAFSQPAFAGRGEFAKARALDRMEGRAEADAETPEPGPGAEPLPPQPPETPTTPAPAGPTVKVYCAIPQDHVGNLEALCQKHKGSLRLYWNYRNLVFMKRVACVVEASKRNTAFLNRLYEDFNGKKIGKVELRVDMSVRSTLHGVNKAKAAQRVASFEEQDAILAPIVKEPYGARAKIFHILAKNFGGITDALAVPGREWAGLGKERVYLYNPDVTIEMVGLDMNGKNKNVTMFKETYRYRTIKRDKGYSWGK